MGFPPRVANLQPLQYTKSETGSQALIAITPRERRRRAWGGCRADDRYYTGSGLRSYHQTTDLEVAVNRSRSDADPRRGSRHLQVTGHRHGKRARRVGARRHLQVGGSDSYHDSRADRRRRYLKSTGNASRNRRRTSNDRGQNEVASHTRDLGNAGRAPQYPTPRSPPPAGIGWDRRVVVTSERAQLQRSGDR